MLKIIQQNKKIKRLKANTFQYTHPYAHQKQPVGKNNIKTYHTFTFTEIYHGSQVPKMCCLVADNLGRCCLMLKNHKHIAPASACNSPREISFLPPTHMFLPANDLHLHPTHRNLAHNNSAINVMRHTDLIVTLGMLTRQKTLSFTIREGLLGPCPQVFF